MYDPARDIFTSSDDAPSDAVATADRSDDLPVNGPKRAIAADGGTPETLEPEVAPSADRGKSPTARDGSDFDRKPPATAVPALSPKMAGLQATSSVTPSGKRKKRSRSPDGGADAGAPPPYSPKSQSNPASAPDAGGPLSGSYAAPPSKKRRSTSPKREGSSYESPVPMTATNLPRFSKKKSGQPPTGLRSRSPAREAPRRRRRSSSPPPRRRSRSGDRRAHDGRREDRREERRDERRDERRRDRPSPIRRRSRSPSPLRRSPSPPPRSPPRKLKRPGGASRLTAAERDAARQRQLDREKEQLRTAQAESALRGVQDVVKQHYNAVPERGREWRKTDSKIRGLRSFNNWVKSTIIQKFSPNEDFKTRGTENTRFAEGVEGGGFEAQERSRGLLVLDIGCGKGGDLGKWQQAPQPVDLYVGVDPADVSIDQAKERYRQMREGGGRGGRGGRGGFRGARSRKDFEAYFFAKDAYGEWLGDIPLIKDVGIDGSAGPGAAGAASARWGGGGFDVVSMMFCMHYAFENETKARGMLRNVAGSLKKGGRLLGVIPNSDMLTEKVVEFHQRAKKASPDASGSKTATSAANGEGQEGGEKEDGEVDEVPEWGNSIYRVRFPGKTPDDGIFRPPFGWKYSFFLDEAVEEVPEYVVPWEAFRAIAEDYNLELQYRKPFTDVWKEENDDPVMGPLSERMNVRERGKGRLLVSDDEMEAASFYLAFCFYKV